MTFDYNRPVGTKATAVGNCNRGSWTRQLRERLHALVPKNEFIAATSDVTPQTENISWDKGQVWTSTRIRNDHLAVISLLQTRHLKNTGKEISRAEVLAALMAAGLEPVINTLPFSPARPVTRFL